MGPADPHLAGVEDRDHLVHGVRPDFRHGPHQAECGLTRDRGPQIVGVYERFVDLPAMPERYRAFAHRLRIRQDPGGRRRIQFGEGFTQFRGTGGVMAGEVERALPQPGRLLGARTGRRPMMDEREMLHEFADRPVAARRNGGRRIGVGNRGEELALEIGKQQWEIETGKRAHGVKLP